MKNLSIVITPFIAFSLSISFQCWAQPTITADGPLEFCHGDSVMLCVEPNTYASYLWNNGSSTSCIMVTEDGEYWPSLMDNLGNFDNSLADTPVSVIVHSPEPDFEAHGDTLTVTGQFESYQWYFLDTLIVGATDSFIVAPGVTGSCCYMVEVTDAFGCVGNSECIDFGFGTSCLTDIDAPPQHDFTICPNPASTYISLSVEGGRLSQIILFDIAGKEVGPLPLLSETEKAITLNVSGLPAGIYFGRVGIGESIRSFKWVKQ